MFDDIADRSNKLMMDGGSHGMACVQMEHDNTTMQRAAKISARLKGLDSNINKLKTKYSEGDVRKFIHQVFESENRKGQG